MNQDSLKALFREQELRNHQERNKKLIANALALANEPLAPEDKRANEAALRQIRRVQLDLEKELSPGYWTRLWRALWNK